MTKEIWAAVIIAIVQIIVTVLVAWWQIMNAKAIITPEQNQQPHKTNLLDNILKYLSKYPLHILIPLLLNVLLIVYFYIKYNSVLTTTIYVAWTVLTLLSQFFVYSTNKAIDKLMEVVGSTINVQKHIMNRLLCHESILFELTDKPCKDDGECKFKD